MPTQTPDKSNKKRFRSGNTPTDDKKASKKQKDKMDDIAMFEQSVENIKEQLDSIVNSPTKQETLKDSNASKLDDLARSIEYLTESVNEVKAALIESQKEMKEIKLMKEELYSIKVHNQVLTERLISQEDYSRRDNIIVSGLKESRDENCRDVVRTLLKEVFNMENVVIVRTHRLGGMNQQNRKLIIRFQNYSDKEHVMRNRKRLKDKRASVYVDDDFSVETSRRRSSLIPVLRELKKVDIRAHLRGDKIYSRGRLFSHRQLYDLPIDPHVACTESVGDVTVFSGTYSKLSNLYWHPFNLEGREWHSVEHFYQYKKALSAGESNAAREIRMTTDPLDAMARGKAVTPGPAWEKDGPEVMKSAMTAKFDIPPLGLALRNTKTIIAEATRNTFWGIGITKTNRDCFNKGKWTGENMAGKVLMCVKSELKKGK